MSYQNVVRAVLIVLQIASALFAFLAAYWWWKSAKVMTPSRFRITVIKPSMGILGGPMDGTYMGEGYSQELTQLGSALSLQARLSGKGARYAAIAAGIQAVAVILDALN